MKSKIHLALILSITVIFCIDVQMPAGAIIPYLKQAKRGNPIKNITEQYREAFSRIKELNHKDLKPSSTHLVKPLDILASQDLRLKQFGNLIPLSHNLRKASESFYKTVGTTDVAKKLASYLSEPVKSDVVNSSCHPQRHSLYFSISPYQHTGDISCKKNMIT